MAEESLPVEEARRHVLIAHCLLAAIVRLRRVPQGADLFLDRAALLVTSNPDQGIYLQTLALQRWEQGRPKEAQAHLAQVLRLSRKGSPEMGRAQLLLGLLHLVEGVTLARPVPLLRSAIDSIDAAYHPLLALLARLGLALALGQAGDLTAAAEHRSEAQALFSLLGEFPEALLYPAWLDARVAVLTAPERAFEDLQAARRDLLEHQFCFAGTLATVDAVLLLAQQGQAQRIPEFLARAPLPLALPPATLLCENLADLPAAPRARARRLLALRREALRLPTLLRRVSILRRIAIEPLPFV